MSVPPQAEFVRRARAADAAAVAAAEDQKVLLEAADRFMRERG
jgi:hypothetical protein